MKLSEFIIDIGRPVAYYPALKKITGSTTATVLLCQLIYWVGKEKTNGGWIYKTSDVIEEETGLSYYEQKTAREKLCKAGLLQERYARTEHQIYFHPELDVIDQKWQENKAEGNEDLPQCPPMRQHLIPECDNTSFPNEDLPHSLNESETTTETTQDDFSSKLSEESPEAYFAQLDAEKRKKNLPPPKRTPEEIRAGIGQALEHFYENSLIGDKKPEIENYIQKLPECIQGAARVFCYHLGRPPLGDEKNYWRKGFNAWVDLGINERHIEAAIREMEGEGMMIKSPDSVRIFAEKAKKNQAPLQSGYHGAAVLEISDAAAKLLKRNRNE